MPSEPEWLEPENVIAFCRKAVARTGEPYLLLRAELLLSALARVRNYWHYGEDDVGVLAAILLLGIARNHPFEQGNKRAALMAALAFLHVNGYRVVVDNQYHLADAIRAAVERRLSEEDFIDYFSSLVMPR